MLCYNPHMEIVRQILQAKFQKANWVITQPVHGLQKAGYIAQNYDCTAFLEDFIATLHKTSNPHAVFQE
jgi:hypothetical protein